jgi:predicted SprT family Zn-dependent metalloprotease
MKIVRSAARLDPQFYGKVRESIVATHERLIRADLATPDIRNYLNGVRVTFSERMVSSAGQAKLRKDSIVLNARLLAAHPDHLPQVVVHEVAHLLAHKFHGDRGHGPAWKQLMELLGVEARRCHSLDTRDIRAMCWFENAKTGQGSGRSHWRPRP